MSTHHVHEVVAPAEDARITLSTRGGWCQWIPASEDVSARMIELGAREFLRYRGVRTVEVLMQHGDRSRLMVWRGLEESPIKVIPDEITDNPGYVSGRSWPIVH